MLRQGALTEKLMILGVDGMDPRFTKRRLREGKMPNTQKLIDAGACREDLMMLGANPTITPPLWATLATGAYPMTHGIYDYAISGEPHKEITINAFSSAFFLYTTSCSYVPFLWLCTCAIISSAVWE